MPTLVTTYVLVPVRRLLFPLPGMEGLGTGALRLEKEPEIFRVDTGGKPGNKSDTGLRLWGR